MGNPTSAKAAAGKYFKYAFGEILLVVIGILIALQINNWNEQRKLKNEEHELLGNLKLEFDRKLAELEDKNKGRLANVEDIEKLLQVIANQDFDFPEDKALDLMENLGVWFYVNEEFSIIEMLFNSGKINSISNDSLKAKLISWPDQMEEMLEEQRVLQDFTINKLEPLIYNYMSATRLVSYYRRASESDKTDSLGLHPHDLRGLLMDRSFENTLSYRKLFLSVNYRDSEILIESAKSIIALIEKELNP